MLLRPLPAILAMVRCHSFAMRLDQLALLQPHLHLPPLLFLLPRQPTAVFPARTRLALLPGLVVAVVPKLRHPGTSPSLAAMPHLQPLAPLPPQRRLVFPPTATESFQSLAVHRHRQWRPPATALFPPPQQARPQSVVRGHSLPCLQKRPAMETFPCLPAWPRRGSRVATAPCPASQKARRATAVALHLEVRGMGRFRRATPSQRRRVATERYQEEDRQRRVGEEVVEEVEKKR
mmetsp:Transcript_16371/g.51224  ORF Transcript_16371/g.51224 Transcript_16371/m.51224 type:complete len:234 (-) Transcript_16371:18-719(-)